MSRTPTSRQTTDPPEVDQLKAPPAVEPTTAPAPPSRWRIIAAAAVLLVLATVVVLGLLRDAPTAPADGPVPDRGADEPAADPPPANPPQTFTPTDEPPPSLDGLVGEDFLTVMRTNYSYYEWLHEHPAGVADGAPAAELLSNITHPDCSCNIEKRLLAHYAERGWWWTGGKIKVRSVEVLERPTPNRVRVRILFGPYEGSQVIDAAGNVHDREPPSPPYVEEQVLIREGPDTPWRTLDTANQGLVGE